MTRPLIVGLTGGIGVGKSTVAGLMASRGAEVVDVDALGRSVLEPDGAAYDAVMATFGEAIRGEDGRIERAALAAAVFGDESRLPELEAISHPAINAVLAETIAASRAALIVLDMAVLVESELGCTASGPVYQRVIVVEAPDEARLSRLVSRGMSPADARDRMASQASNEERRAVADLIITNGGALSDLHHHVGLIWPTIEAWQTQVA